MPSSLPSRPHASRRGFLVGTGLAVLGAGGGVAAGVLTHRSSDEVDVPDPTVLLAAVRTEQDLVAGIDDTLATGPTGVSADLLRALRTDHQAHLSALLASVAVAVGSPSPSVPAARRRPGRSLSPEQLRMKETAAAKAMAQRALTLTGRNAALLASISAAEATHAELLAE